MITEEQATRFPHAARLQEDLDSMAESGAVKPSRIARLQALLDLATDIAEANATGDTEAVELGTEQLQELLQ